LSEKKSRRHVSFFGQKTNYPTLNHSIMDYRNKQILFFLFLLALPFGGLLAQNRIVVKGKVVDAKTQEPLPFASVFFKGTTTGTETDLDGLFEYSGRRASDTLAAAFMGYETQFIVLPPDVKTHEVTFALEEAGGFNLQEVVIKTSRKGYKRKGNPAVQLWRNVLAHVDENRPQRYDFYDYEKYEKIELALNNVDEKMKKKRAFKNFQFLFEYVDTSDLNGKPTLPVFIRETASHVYYRKDPEAIKEYRSGIKVSGLDDYLDKEDFTVVADYLYQDVDIYADKILVFDKQFPSPLGGFVANHTYRFYITDTLNYNGNDVIRLDFVPASKGDIAFEGYMYVKADSSYAVVKAELGVNPRVNLNFVNDLKFVQEFHQVGDVWVLNKDEIAIDFSPRKKGLGFLASRSVLYDEHRFNEPIADEKFKGTENVIEAEDAYAKGDDFWSTVRQEALSPTESGIYEMIDTLQKVPTFRAIANVGRLLFSGYQPVGPVDIGPVGAFYSFNAVEGFRGRLGGQTNLNFHPKIRLEGYGVYGFGDKRWKYAGGIMYSFRKNFEENPRHYLRFAYQHETKFVGQQLKFVAENNFFLSFKRGDDTRMMLLDSYLGEYFLEFDNNLSFLTTYNHVVRNPIGNFAFDFYDKETGEPASLSKVTTTELGFKARFAPNEQYIQTKNYRIPIYNKYPTFELEYKGGFKNLGSDYDYHRLTLKIFKRFFLSVLGTTRLELEGGRIWADGAPYFLLHLPQANQTYAYRTGYFNLMNYMEFASDKWGIVNIEHAFEGFFFNKIPLLKRLKLREVATFRAIYGGLDDRNNPNKNPELIQFLETNDGRKITYTLEGQPYMEASVGVYNIFKLLRVDLVQRLNYLDQPNVPTMFNVKGLAFRVGAKVQF